MAKKILYIVCGVALILFGILVFNLIPDYGVYTSLSTIPPMSHVDSAFFQWIISWLYYLRIGVRNFLYPATITWLYNLTVLFYIVFGLYVIYTCFIPKYKITVAMSSIMVALGLGSSVAMLYHFFRIGISYGYVYIVPGQPKDYFTRFIQLIAPHINVLHLPITCGIFVHILLVIFVLINFVLLLRDKPKNRKTKYQTAGALGGILLILTMLSRLYVLKSSNETYYFGAILSEHNWASYLPLSILFSFATSYGLFRILSASVLRTRAKDASDTQD